MQLYAALDYYRLSLYGNIKLLTCSTIILHQVVYYITFYVHRFYLKYKIAGI